MTVGTRSRFSDPRGQLLSGFLFICALLLSLATGLPAACQADEVKPDEAVVFFPTCGHFDQRQQAWIVPLHGWLFKPEEDSLTSRFALSALRRALDLEPRPDEEPVFARRGGPFVADNVDGRELSVRLGSDFVLLEPSGENGHAAGTIRLPLALAQAVSRDGWLRYQADTSDGDPRELAGAAMLLPPRGVSVISDVDDTIKITQVAQRGEMLANTFLRPMEPVPGMVELYRRWAADAAVFHYVTASPWQLYVPLEEFRHSAGFPAGTFDMAQFRWKDRTVFNLFVNPDKLKRAAIENLLTRFPERRFICVGDSGQHDPELYAALAREHPQQIIGIYIRNVTRETPDNDRFRRVFANLSPNLWRLFNDPVELNEVLIPAVQPAGGD
ncbi:MAG TPA: App1 family protein [Pirellulales bacterium]|nr:App1 family protein [Pirellulales bacterium]